LKVAALRPGAAEVTVALTKEERNHRHRARTKRETEKRNAQKNLLQPLDKGGVLPTTAEGWYQASIPFKSPKSSVRGGQIKAGAACSPRQEHAHRENPTSDSVKHLASTTPTGEIGLRRRNAFGRKSLTRTDRSPENGNRQVEGKVRKGGDYQDIL